MSLFPKLSQGFTTRSPEETMELAARITHAIPEDCAIALSGPLGSGKTTFVKGVGDALGIHNPITSPTYTVYNLYYGNRQLLHIDAYRLNTAREIDNLMLEDFLRSPFLIAAEWPECIEDWLQTFPLYKIELSPIPGDGHLIKLTQIPD